MEKHSKTFEQYCCVMEKNIIMEETSYHNGKKSLRCVNHIICEMNGGCKNRILKDSMVKSG